MIVHDIIFTVVSLLTVLTLMAMAQIGKMQTECDELSMIRVKSQWRKAYLHGQSRTNFAVAIWRTVFQLMPDARDELVEKGSNDTTSGEFRSFALNFLAHVDMAVTLLDDYGAEQEFFDYVYRIRDEKNVPTELVDIFVRALGYVAPAQLDGCCFDRSAWKACFKYIGDGIKGER